MIYDILFDINERIEKLDKKIEYFALATIDMDTEYAINGMLKRINKKIRLIAQYDKAKDLFRKLGEDDKKIIIYNCKHHLSKQQIADKMHIALRTVFRKLQKLEEGDAYFKAKGSRRSNKIKRS